MTRIKALDSDVVHKIAAGEIIVRPSNAIKELIENSIDAKATRIDVLVKEGGSKSLQITDNGQGIDADDFPILCHRFTTSKLSEVEDLETIATLGFRGEALASISHVSHLTVKTKTKDSKVATQADFLAGELVEGTQKKSAGVNGTQITVADLFYNSRYRSEAFDKRKSRTEEYHRILETVQQYAILYNNVNFTVKRAEDTQPVVVSGKTVKDRIRSVYELGGQDLLEISEKGDENDKKLGLLEVMGYSTGLNFTKRGPDMLVLFINKRLVTWGKLSSAIRNLYSKAMPLGSAHYFVFLSLSIESQNVDVNVHPTKREVKVLFEDEINDRIARILENALMKTEGSRDFRVQSYIASTTLPPSSPSTSRLSISSSSPTGRSTPSSTGSSFRGTQTNRYEYNLVRTDPKQQTLTPYIQSTASKTSVRNIPLRPTRERRSARREASTEESDSDESDENTDDNEQGDESESESENENEVQADEDAEAERLTSKAPSTPAATQDEIMVDSHCCSDHDEGEIPASPQTPHIRAPAEESQPYTSPIKSMKSEKTFKDANLASVEMLITEVKSQASPELSKLITEHTFVGIVDTKRGLAAVQWDVRLYLIDYMEMCFEMFYQIALTQFANFGTVYLGDGSSLHELSKLNARVSQDTTLATSETNEDQIQQIIEMSSMLEEYFQIKSKYRNEEWVLTQSPLSLPEYVPPASRLPQFVRDLLVVDWHHEKECIYGVTRASAALYVPSNTVSRSQMMLIFDRAKFGFVPSNGLKSCVTEIANLPGLYRVFERC